MEYREQKMDEQIEGASHLERQILEDPFVIALNNQIVRIHQLSLPKMYLMKSGELKVVHDEKIQSVIDWLVDFRDKYIESTYGDFKAKHSKRGRSPLYTESRLSVCNSVG